MPPARTHRLDLWPALTIVGLACLLLALISSRQFIDPDAYHEMALARATIDRGSVPTKDIFSYTPTRPYVVHHEWGAGMALYAATFAAGAAGVLALKYAIIAALCIVVTSAARRSGAHWPSILVLSPLAILMVSIGFTTIRAQMYTLLAVAMLLYAIAVDRRGGRWWIVPWLCVHVIWLNLHAGFVVGMIILAAHWVEQILRTRRTQWHLVATGLAMAMLVLVNPFGWRYVPFLLESLLLPRPHVTEWLPLWSAPGRALLIPFFGFSLLIIVYAGWRGGWRRLAGILILALCAYAAVRHTRHLSLYAVAWFAMVPSYVQATPLGLMLERALHRRWAVIAALTATIGVACLAVISRTSPPWSLHLPVTLADEKRLGVAYPVGPVKYLREIDFRGNVLTPFTAGAFVSWHLAPSVRVGLDGRYECAYDRGVVEQFIDFYKGLDGWNEALEQYPTDLVMVTHSRAIAPLLETRTDWLCVYRDDTFALYARPGLILPVVDRRGEELSGPMF